MFNCWCTWLDIKFTEPVLISEPFRIGSDRFILNQPPVLSGSSHHSCPDPVTFLFRIQSPFLSGSSSHLSGPNPVTILVRIQSPFCSGSSHLSGPDPVNFLVRIQSPFWSGSSHLSGPDPVTFLVRIRRRRMFLFFKKNPAKFFYKWNRTNLTKYTFCIFLRIFLCVKIIFQVCLVHINQNIKSRFGQRCSLNDKL